MTAILVGGKEEAAPVFARPQYGVHDSAGRDPADVSLITGLGASIVRINMGVAGPKANRTGAKFLDAGLDLVLTCNYVNPTNIDTTYGTPTQYPSAGFPALSGTFLTDDIAGMLTSLVP